MAGEGHALAFIEKCWSCFGLSPVSKTLTYNVSTTLWWSSSGNTHTHSEPAYFLIIHKRPDEDCQTVVETLYIKVLFTGENQKQLQRQTSVLAVYGI